MPTDYREREEKLADNVGIQHRLRSICAVLKGSGKWRMCAGGKLSTLVGERQFHGVDAVGAAEHGLSCLVEVAACNKDDEEESPTCWQLLLFSNRGSDISKSALRGFLCRLLLRKASSTLLRLSNPNPQEALCHNWPHCYCSQSRLSRQNLVLRFLHASWCFALLGGR